MYGPKVTVIGAGSYFFGRPIIHKFATSPVMANGTLSLVDTNKEVLQTMMTDPLCNNIEDAKACISALLEAERESLPIYWFDKHINTYPNIFEI